MVTLTQLQYIVAVDTYRHFATAAEKCFVTQPTLSMQIKKLEEFLDVVIFDRSKQPIIPSDIGEGIIEQARVTLREAAKIETFIQEQKETISGTLKIGIIPTLTPYLLPLFIGHFSSKYPHLDIRIEEHYTNVLEDMLKNDLLDVAILVTPLDDDMLHEEPLFYEEMKIYANPEHTLATKPVISVEDVATPEIWLLSDGHCFRHQVINLCRMSGKQQTDLPFNFDGGSLETVMKIINREGGFTLLPELATFDLPEARKKQVRRFTKMRPLREVSMVYARHFSKKKVIELLKKEVCNVLPVRMLTGERGEVVKWR